MKYAFWQTPKAGSLNRLSKHHSELGPLHLAHIRVDVDAIGLNFADIFAVTGLYSATPSGAFTPGLEFAGRIADVGNEVDHYAIGDRVMGLCRFGGYSTVIDATADMLWPIPDNWSISQGAGHLVQALTACYALHELGNVHPGQRVLIHSAAGGVGLRAMAICRALRVDAIGTVGSKEKQSLMADLGYSNVWVRQGNMAQQLADQTFDLVLDAIGGQVQWNSFHRLRPMGRMVVFGAATFTPRSHRPNYLRAAWQYLRRPRYDVMSMISSNRSVMAFNLIWLWQQRHKITPMLAHLDALDIGPPLISRSFDFDQAPQALQYLQSGQSIGKIVLITR